MNTKAFTLAEVAKHNTDADCWLVIEGVVYDVTEFLSEHPGGGDIVVDVAGTSHHPPVRRARRVCFHHPPTRPPLARSLVARPAHPTKASLPGEWRVYRTKSLHICRASLYLPSPKQQTRGRHQIFFLCHGGRRWTLSDSSIARAVCQACVLPRYSDKYLTGCGCVVMRSCRRRRVRSR